MQHGKKLSHYFLAGLAFVVFYRARPTRAHAPPPPKSKSTHTYKHNYKHCYNNKTLTLREMCWSYSAIVAILTTGSVAYTGG